MLKNNKNNDTMEYMLRYYDVIGFYDTKREITMAVMTANTVQTKIICNMYYSTSS